MGTKRGEREDVKEKRERHTWYKNPFFALYPTNFLWSDYTDGQLTVNTFTNKNKVLHTPWLFYYCLPNIDEYCKIPMTSPIGLYNVL